MKPSKRLKINKNYDQQPETENNKRDIPFHRACIDIPPEGAHSCNHGQKSHKDNTQFYDKASRMNNLGDDKVSFSAYSVSTC